MNYIGTLRNEVQEMARGAVALLPNLAIALAVLLVTWVAAKFALRIANLLIGRTRLRPSLRNLVDLSLIHI